MQRANLPYRWQLSTYARMMRLIGDDRDQTCIAGYAATPQREKIAWISKIIAYTPPDAVAVMSDNLHLINQEATIGELLNNRKIRGAFIKGALYGDKMQPLIQIGKARHLFISGGDDDLANLVVHRRVHYAFLNEPQVAFLNQRMAGAKGLVAILLKGMAAPTSRHILCSRSVPISVRRKIDAAILPVTRPE